MMKKMEGKLISMCVLTLVLMPVITVCGSQDIVKEMNFAEMKDDKEITNIDLVDAVKNEDLAINSETPSVPTITGSTIANFHKKFTYVISSKDQQNDEIQYKIIFSDMPAIYLTDFYQSGESISFQHTWSTFYQTSGPYYIYAKAIDAEGHESNWAKFEVNIPENEFKERTCLVCVFLEKLLERYPILETMLGF